MGMLLVRLFGWGLSASALCSCAHSYVDAEGNRHIVGLVKLTIPPATTEPAAADWVRLRHVGLALNRGEFANSLILGYSDNTTAVIRNHSCANLGTLPTAALSLYGEDYASHPDK